MAAHTGPEPSLAPRLATLAGARLAVIRNRKGGSEPFAEGLAAGLRGDHRAEARVWVKSSPYSPLTRAARAEILDWADGAVAAPGDCGHGSSVLLHDIADVERAGGVETPSGRAIAIDTSEKFGLHRALRLAGACPGDTVRDPDVLRRRAREAVPVLAGLLTAPGP